MTTAIIALDVALAVLAVFLVLALRREVERRVRAELQPRDDGEKDRNAEFRTQSSAQHSERSPTAAAAADRLRRQLHLPLPDTNRPGVPRSPDSAPPGSGGGKGDGNDSGR